MQSYLATAEAVDELIEDAELDWRTERQARFAAGNMLDALAPRNFPWSNPAVLRESVDKGGANLVTRRRGTFCARHVKPAPARERRHDQVRARREPRAVARLGRAAHDVFELIHYAPEHREGARGAVAVRAADDQPLLHPRIAPGAACRAARAAGQQVFLISWCNPGAEEGHFDLDTYADAVLEARDAVAEITKQPAVHVNAACSGGIISAGALGHLAAEGSLDEVASLTLRVCALDNERAGTTAALARRETALRRRSPSRRARATSTAARSRGVFAWLRPNDLIWNYVVNNYLLGKDPPAFDMLYWNQDSVRLAAGLHRDFVHLALDNSLAHPGALEVARNARGPRGAVDVDSYIVAGVKDHIIPWENAYRSTQLLGGEPRFVLSTSGHIQALVNPPSDESRSTYRGR